jgi:hypothetical protein
LQTLEEFGRRMMIASFGLNRFDDDSGDRIAFAFPLFN